MIPTNAPMKKIIATNSRSMTQPHFESVTGTEPRPRTSPASLRPGSVASCPLRSRFPLGGGELKWNLIALD